MHPAIVETHFHIWEKTRKIEVKTVTIDHQYSKSLYWIFALQVTFIKTLYYITPVALQ